MSVEMRAFLELLYSLCKQYIAFYERQIKSKAPAGDIRIGEPRRR